MQAHWPRRLFPSAALAAAGAVFAVLAVMDKLFGLVHRPLHLATVAYAILLSLLGWVWLRGIPLKSARLVRVSAYGAVLILNVLTALYVLAWRVSADPTPVLLQSELQRGDDMLASGDKDGAHLAYRDAAKRFPSSFAVLMRLGAVNYQVADYDRAKKYFEQALEQAPRESRWRALNDLGQTYWKLRDPEQAIELYEQAKREGLPKSELVEWHYRLGWAYFDARNLNAAIEHYRAVAEAGKAYSAASYYNIACALAQQIAASKDEGERRSMTQEAVRSLRDAWNAINTEEEQQALRTGLLGGPEERDPELAPLRGSAELKTFLTEIRRTK
ncbi:MAG: tetratricopeptide repeat protein [Actinomycetota bacterium]